MEPTLEQIKTDESVWPEGAEFYLPETEDTWPTYYKVCGKGIQYTCPSIMGWVHWEGDMPSSVIPRPTKTFVPEVGVECEYSLDGINWYVCKVMMFSLHSVFIKSHKENIYYCKEYSIELCRVIFRPIKSERELVVAEAFNILIRNVTAQPREWLGILYEEGMLKLKEPTK